MLNTVAKVLFECWHILNESALYVLFGFFMAALAKAFVPKDLLARHLGKDNLSSVLKASIFGVPLPLCSCGVIPAAIGLRKQGASKGATTAFLISTPESGIDSVAISWALLDPIMTVVRPLAAFLTATVAGVLVNALPERKRAKIGSRHENLTRLPESGTLGGKTQAVPEGNQGTGLALPSESEAIAQPGGT